VILYHNNNNNSNNNNNNNNNNNTYTRPDTKNLMVKKQWQAYHWHSFLH